MSLLCLSNTIHCQHWNHILFCFVIMFVSNTIHCQHWKHILFCFVIMFVSNTIHCQHWNHILFCFVIIVCIQYHSLSTLKSHLILFCHYCLYPIPFTVNIEITSYSVLSLLFVSNTIHCQHWNHILFCFVIIFCIQYHSLSTLKNHAFTPFVMLCDGLIWNPLNVVI